MNFSKNVRYKEHTKSIKLVKFFNKNPDSGKT